MPYVSTLDSHGFNHESPCVVLSPLGRPVLPRSGEEAYNAVACVPQALKVRYEIPVFIICMMLSKVMHVDPPLYRSAS